MTINPILKIIRAKKLGVLVRDAREKSGKDLEECAQAMGLSGEELGAIEYGERALTLPELEILAYYLDIPLEHFWENEILKPSGTDRMVDAQEIKLSRQKVIGDLMREGRTKAGLSSQDLAEQAGISPENLQPYEQGMLPIPLPELESIVRALNSSIAEFEDHQGPAGSWFAEKRNFNEFASLPIELQEFISKPINRPYLDLAIRLSEIKVERLRALAEGLLEITL
jgi:transcriptional regulator with XRE-family HTH domain